MTSLRPFGLCSADTVAVLTVSAVRIQPVESAGLAGWAVGSMAWLAGMIRPPPVT
jgi:hypothetical protein